MKAEISLLALALVLCGPLCAAEDSAPADDWKPAPSNQQGKEYPQVNSEGRVKFRIVAPKAQSVGVRERFQGSRLFIMQCGDGAGGQFAAGFVTREADAKAAHGAADTDVINAARQRA